MKSSVSPISGMCVFFCWNWINNLWQPSQKNTHISTNFNRLFSPSSNPSGVTLKSSARTSILRPWSRWRRRKKMVGNGKGDWKDVTFLIRFFGILKTHLITHTRRVCLMKIMGDFCFFVLSLLVLLRVAGWKILFFSLVVTWNFSGLFHLHS